MISSLARKAFRRPKKRPEVVLLQPGLVKYLQNLHEGSLLRGRLFFFFIHLRFQVDDEMTKRRGNQVWEIRLFWWFIIAVKH